MIDYKKLRQINDKLSIIEKELKIKLKKLNASPDLRINKDSWIDDYEIELTIDAYEKDSDDLLVVLEVPVYKENFDLLDSGINHNDFFGWEGDPMSSDSHCYLFHSLYDHTDLELSDILRIGVIWVDIQVTYQKKFSLK